MTRYEFGQVVLVPFPFTDQTTVKRRPAAVISNERYSRQTENATILAISSKGGRSLDQPVAEWETAGLLKPSLLKPVIRTIESDLVIRTLGSLSERDRMKLEGMLASLFSPEAS